MPKNIKPKTGVKGQKQITTVDGTGKLLQKIISPSVIEFRPKDLLQIIVGATILAIPVGFTEETWRLGETLPLLNVITLLITSLLFIASFVYYHYHRHYHHLGWHWVEYIKRVFSTYVVSFIVVAFLLTIIQKTPWTIDWVLSFKRVVLVAFPASMSAAVADTIR